MSVSVVETDNDGGSGSSITVAMPSTLSGRLVVAVATNGPPSSVTWPAGWSVVVDDTDGDGSTSGMYVAWRDLNGTEGSSITVTLGDSQTYAWVWTRYSGHDAGAPDVSSVYDSGAANAVPDPPSLTPAGGSDEYMWVAVGATDSSDYNFIAGYPTNYSLGQIEAGFDTVGAAAPSVAMASRLLTAASEDPGAFSMDTDNDQSLAVTLALAPDAGTGPAMSVLAYLFRQMIGGYS
jgi:hypothetical protein